MYKHKTFDEKRVWYIKPIHQPRFKNWFEFIPYIWFDVVLTNCTWTYWLKLWLCTSYVQVMYKKTDNIPLAIGKIILLPCYHIIQHWSNVFSRWCIQHNPFCNTVTCLTLNLYTMSIGFHFVHTMPSIVRPRYLFAFGKSSWQQFSRCGQYHRSHNFHNRQLQATKHVNRIFMRECFYFI